MITDGIRGTIIGGSKDERKERRKRLVQYIDDTLHMHNMYAIGYFFCEFLNFANVVSNRDIFRARLYVMNFTRTETLVSLFPYRVTN